MWECFVARGRAVKMEPEVLAHSCALWPVSVDVDCFEQYLLGYSASDCSAEHIRRFTETHKLPPDFFQLRTKTPTVQGARPEAPRNTTPLHTFNLPPTLVSSDADDVAMQALGPQQREYVALFKADQRHLGQWFEDQLQFFRTLEADEGYFAEPLVFVNLQALPLHPAVRRELVQRYYTVDDVVLSRCFGCRLSKAEIDAVVQELEPDLTERWIRRQCDNLRRVHRVIVAGYRKSLTGIDRGSQFEPQYPCFEAIQETFELSQSQTRVYAIATFAMEYQLRVEPFVLLPLSSSLVLTEAAMEGWCHGNMLLISPAFKASVAVVGRALSDPATLRDLCAALGATLSLNPMLAAMAKLRPGGSSSAGDPADTASAQGPSSPSPTTPTTQSRWKYSAKLQEDLVPILRTVGRVAKLFAYSKDDIASVFKLLYMSLFKPYVRCCGPAQEPSSNPRSTTVAAAPDSPKHEPREVIALCAQVAHCLVQLRAVPAAHRDDILRFFVVLKLCLQLVSGALSA